MRQKILGSNSPANNALLGRCWIDASSNVCQHRSNVATNIGPMRFCTKVLHLVNSGILQWSTSEPGWAQYWQNNVANVDQCRETAASQHWNLHRSYFVELHFRSSSYACEGPLLPRSVTMTLLRLPSFVFKQPATFLCN